jgi:hypothetical protein
VPRLPQKARLERRYRAGAANVRMAEGAFLNLEYSSAMGLQIIPKGEDRSWNKATYEAMRAIVRRIEFDHRAEIEKAASDALMECWTKGIGYFRVQG